MCVVKVPFLVRVLVSRIQDEVYTELHIAVTTEARIGPEVRDSSIPIVVRLEIGTKTEGALHVVFDDCLCVSVERVLDRSNGRIEGSRSRQAKGLSGSLTVGVHSSTVSNHSVPGWTGPGVARRRSAC